MTPETEITSSVEPTPPSTLAQDLASAFAPQQEPPPVVEPQPAAPPLAVATVVEQAPVPVEVAPVEQSLEPTMPNYLAEITQLAGLPLTEALPRGVEQLRALAAYDPPAEEILFQTVYAANRAEIHSIALREMGVEPARVKEFNDWVKAGATPLPQVAAQGFPEPDADNQVVVNGVRYDLNDATEKEAYEDKRALYELKMDKQARESERVENERRTVEQQLKDSQAAQVKLESGRHGEFMTARLGEIEKLFRSSSITFAPEDKWLEEFVIAGVFRALQNDPKISKLHADADAYVKAGAGRTTDFAAQIDRENRRIVTEMLDKFNRRFLRANQAEKAIAATSPILPEGTRKVEVQTPAIEAQKPVTAQDANRIHLANVQTALANAFPKQ